MVGAGQSMVLMYGIPYPISNIDIPTELGTAADTADTADR